MNRRSVLLENLAGPRHPGICRAAAAILASTRWPRPLPRQPSADPGFASSMSPPPPASSSNTTAAPSAANFLPETLGSGCAFLDYDNDGWQDILLVNGMDWPGHKRQHSTLTPLPQ